MSASCAVGPSRQPLAPDAEHEDALVALERVEGGLDVVERHPAEDLARHPLIPPGRLRVQARGRPHASA
jgi:hypothetical protein